MLIFNSGWVYRVEIFDYTPERPAPFAQTPDSPGFDDEGDAKEVSYRLISMDPDRRDEERGPVLRSGELDDLILEQCRLDTEEKL